MERVEYLRDAKCIIASYCSNPREVFKQLGKYDKFIRENGPQEIIDGIELLVRKNKSKKLTFCDLEEEFGAHNNRISWTSSKKPSSDQYDSCSSRFG